METTVVTSQGPGLLLPVRNFRRPLRASAVSSADERGRLGFQPKPRATRSPQDKAGAGGLRVCGCSLSGPPLLAFLPHEGSWAPTTRRDQDELDLSGVLGIPEPQFPICEMDALMPNWYYLRFSKRQSWVAGRALTSRNWLTDCGDWQVQDPRDGPAGGAQAAAPPLFWEAPSLP